jgi:hypothetical protein
MKKKSNRAQKRVDNPDPTHKLGNSPLYTGVRAEGIRLDQALGVQICLDCWTNCFDASDEPTMITIQEWKGDRWEVKDVIGLADRKASHALPLDPLRFPGRYKGERVLTVFKPRAKPSS